MVEQPRTSPDASDHNSPKLISHLTYSTKDLPEQEQFGGWREFISSTVDLSLLEPRDQRFEAEQQVWDLGRFALTRATMPRGVSRTWRHLDKDPLDHWCLVVVQNAGAGHAGREEPRLIGFRSLGRPFEGAAADSDVLSLFVPRDVFRGMTDMIDAADNVIPDAGLGAVLADFVVSLQRRLPGMTRAELPQIDEATRSIIMACLAPTLDHKAAAQNAIAATLLERARQIIEANLGSPELGADLLCRSLGVSRSRLYRLFEPSGGVAHAVQRQRLQKAHERLSDRRNDRPIVQIAEGLGFSDASGFSRSFKKEFGYSPSAARAAGVIGLPAPRAGRRAWPAATGKLGDVLRGLHV
ncbi:Transcriptional regulator, AraC family [Methylocella tundrae]|uniref:Transcriptional regulator, AraC family n=1 Tax=Methylocella tundrae TaxID=227605 RepID=A0A8B6MCU8_METTU|nr:helix-turn-helix domain-containing protein [Methylocella tundrae]VTZ26439.1 Transcriptional regulator, AraC family [Methylocella tundrae]VTZ52058.1 Transcriptional regulator, AraC family [Methylocella tundrae]